eukprot:TRINITY_DN20350_c0_g1_i2.p2 TRINITY_DN20350_c0_g1~~TRINITY_DN20350_c0_g1_i2.p2  ORF type:complete len:129 (-),score=8.81 TRINITY_DN20350_c0_g1_i2:448-834(-)
MTKVWYTVNSLLMVHVQYSCMCNLAVRYVFFFNETATTEIYTLHIVGSVRCVQETDYVPQVELVINYNYLNQIHMQKIRFQFIVYFSPSDKLCYHHLQYQFQFLVLYHQFIKHCILAFLYKNKVSDLV